MDRQLKWNASWTRCQVMSRKLTKHALLMSSRCSTPGVSSNALTELTTGVSLRVNRRSERLIHPRPPRILLRASEHDTRPTRSRRLRRLPHSLLNNSIAQHLLNLGAWEYALGLLNHARQPLEMRRPLEVHRHADPHKSRQWTDSLRDARRRVDCDGHPDSV